MLKKAALVLMAVIMAVSFVGCTSSAATVKQFPPDKKPILLPEKLLPDGVTAVYDEVSKSSAYYEAVMTPEQVTEFYNKAFEEMKIEVIKEFTEEDLISQGIVPKMNHNDGEIAWAAYGTYIDEKAVQEVSTSDSVTIENVPVDVFVVCASSGDKVGVEVSVGYRAANTAIAFGLKSAEKE